MIPLEKSESLEILKKSDTNNTDDAKKEAPIPMTSNVNRETAVTSTEEKPSLFDMISKMQEKLINQTNSMTSVSTHPAQANLNNFNQKSSQSYFESFFY